jgi:DNA-binding GntR family transcriptional regulator
MEAMIPQTEQVLPKYLQIANSIRDEILAGNLGPGDEVASERDLALDWRVARPTAARALAELRRLGLVESVRGAGTFVAAPPMAHRAQERYQNFRSRGVVYAPTEHAEIVAAEVVAAPDRVSAALGLDEGAMVIRRQRRTLEGDRVNEVSVSWFDGSLVDIAPRLLERERIREGTTAYVEQITGRVATSAEERECARRPTVEEAALLGVARGSAVLATEHRVLDAAGFPMEWAESACPAGRWTPLRRYRLRP